MPDQPPDLIQGTLEMLILKTLALTPMHGYGIAMRIEQISDGAFRVNPGSLLPALSRMERAGRVKGDWRATENNRRARYYALTEKGRRAPQERNRKLGAPDRRHQPHPRGIAMGLLRSTQDGIRALRDKSARNDEIDEELESFLGGPSTRRCAMA